MLHIRHCAPISHRALRPRSFAAHSRSCCRSATTSVPECLRGWKAHLANTEPVQDIGHELLEAHVLETGDRFRRGKVPSSRVASSLALCGLSLQASHLKIRRRTALYTSCTNIQWASAEDETHVRTYFVTSPSARPSSVRVDEGGNPANHKETHS